MKTTTQNKKIATLYSFFLKNGFDHTLEEIALRMGISLKTIFNRYQNRENMEEVAVQYWYDIFIERYEQKRQHCNNAIECMLIFVYEIKQSYISEKYFLGKALSSCECENRFSHTLKAVCTQGLEENLFVKEINPGLYVRYFLFNIFHLFLYEQDEIEIIEYLLVPLLNEKGVAILEDIHLESFLAV